MYGLTGNYLILVLWIFMPWHITNDNLKRHPFYVSVTELNYNAKEKTLEISCKIFTNDFEAALQRASPDKIDLSDAKFKPGNEKAIAAYIAKHLHLIVDNSPVLLQFVGSEQEKEATWSYFQVNEVKSFRKIAIINDILYELYPSEINIIHMTANSQRKSTKLASPERQATFDF